MSQRGTHRALAVIALAAGAPAAGSVQADDVSFADVLALPARPADARVSYGETAEQFGELWLPSTPPPHAVAVVVHGGCWSALYGEAHVRPMCAAIARAGVAAWCLEYRRIGDTDGAWPGTFTDVARGTDHLRVIARSHGLDLSRVAAVGHSAGGQLALWLAARARRPADDPVRGAQPLPIRGVVGLAPIADLPRAARESVCGTAVPRLLGGPPENQAPRYTAVSPQTLVPLGVPQVIVQGSDDRIVPADISVDYVDAARAKGDAARLVLIEGAGHFDLIAPTSPAWARVEAAVRDVLKK